MCIWHMLGRYICVRCVLGCKCVWRGMGGVCMCVPLSVCGVVQVCVAWMCGTYVCDMCVDVCI